MNLNSWSLTSSVVDWTLQPLGACSYPLPRLFCRYPECHARFHLVVCLDECSMGMYVVSVLYATVFARSAIWNLPYFSLVPGCPEDKLELFETYRSLGNCKFAYRRSSLIWWARFFLPSRSTEIPCCYRTKLEDRNPPAPPNVASSLWRFCCCIPCTICCRYTSFEKSFIGFYVLTRRRAKVG